jgi:hypothetical protein
MTAADLDIDSCSVSGRSFHGLGVQMDAYIFDDANRACGVTEEDLDLIARRVRAIRPGVARIFVEVSWFNPSLDGVTLVWDRPEYRNLVRQLRLLTETQTPVNLVLFTPFPGVGRDMEPAIRAMLAGFERLIGVDSCSNVQWLTLWNEPDGMFFHDSPLYGRIFGDRGASARPPWAEYARLNRLAHAELVRRGLHPRVKMMVADTVWGAPMRMERMRLSLEAFGDLDVSYGYHNYNPENLEFYEGNPDYAYGGMAAEAAAFRRLLGSDRELILWEFNTPGTAGFSGYYLGVGPGGEDRVSSFAGAVDVADKVLAGLAAGLDGFCLWCLHDLIHMSNLHAGVMPCGLWRYKGQKWLPRPVYHYYGALMETFRPGAQLHGVQGCPSGVRALAATAERRTLALLNTTPAPVTVRVPWAGPAERLRLAPEHLPVASDLPLSTYAPAPVAAGAVTIELRPMELSVVR